jgi:hypothetical protein
MSHAWNSESNGEADRRAVKAANGASYRRAYRFTFALNSRSDEFSDLPANGCSHEVTYYRKAHFDPHGGTYAFSDAASFDGGTYAFSDAASFDGSNDMPDIATSDGAANCI